MAKKIVTSFNINKAVSRTSRPSVFDRIVKEIDAKEIPTEYIDQILVQYTDGNIVDLSGNDLINPLLIDKTSLCDIMDYPFRQIRDVEIFIKSDKLEDDINDVVEYYLGIYC